MPDLGSYNSMNVEMKMKKSMRAGKTLFLIVCFCVMGLTACGEKTQESTGEEAAVSSISVNKDGSISSRIVEDFGESYYDAGGLKTMIESAIADYKGQDSTAQVTLKKCEASDGSVNVLMEFADYKSYAGFNGENFFAGTIQAANQAGFDLNVTLQAVSDNADLTSVSKPELLGMGDNHIVIFEAAGTDGAEAQPMRINCFDEILYAGEGVVAVGKKSADVTVSGGYGMIVFK